jgi:hypothetical protein
VGAAVLPVLLLVVVLAGFFLANPFTVLESGDEPLPGVTTSYASLPNDETIVLHVTNNGPGEVTVSQVLVDEAYWDLTVAGSGGDATLAPLKTARVVIPYHWQPGWDVETALILSDGATVHHTVVAPSVSPRLSGSVLPTLAVVGVFVGAIPAVLGMFWFPFLQSMSDRALHAVLAFSAGILVLLAIDAGIEAVELTESIPGAFDGLILVVLGVVGSLLLDQSISAWRRGPAEAGDARASNGLWVACLVAVGIGLHDPAEGLVIGSSFALGAIAGVPSSSVGGSEVWRSRRRSGRSSPRSASGPSSRSSSSCAAWSAGRAASGRRSTS